MKKVLLCLDLTYMDQFLLGYLKFLQDSTLEIEQIECYHNIHLDVSDSSAAFLKKLDEPLGDILEKKIRKKVANTFPELDISITIEEHPDTADAIYKHIKRGNFATVIFGKKVTYDGSGYLMERLLNKQPQVDMLIVPETAVHKLEYILAPVDFSKKTASTLDKTDKLLVQPLKSSLHCLHVYELPTIYFPYIPSKDMKLQLEKEAVDNWKKFSERYLRYLKIQDFSLRHHGERTIAQTIYNFALENQADAVVVHMEHRFTLSKAIQLLKLDMHMPLFIL